MADGIQMMMMMVQYRPVSGHVVGSFPVWLVLAARNPPAYVGFVRLVEIWRWTAGTRNDGSRVDVFGTFTDCTGANEFLLSALGGFHQPMVLAV